MDTSFKPTDHDTNSSWWLHPVEVLRSAYIWFACASMVLIFFPIVFVVWLTERDPTHPRTSVWVMRLSRLVTRVNPLIRLEFEGRHIPRADQAYVVVANHQSLTDIPLLSHLPVNMKWVAKASLFQVPVLGKLMTWNGDIPVDFTSPNRKKTVLEQTTACIEGGSNVVFFPEGRRSADGRVHRFYDGAFELAIKTGVPVLPVALDGLWDFLPSHSWRFAGARTIRLKVLKPIETTDLSLRDTAWLREKARGRMLGQLARWRGVSSDRLDALEGGSGEQESPLDEPFVLFQR